MTQAATMTEPSEAMIDAGMEAFGNTELVGHCFTRRALAAAYVAMTAQGSAALPSEAEEPTYGSYFEGEHLPLGSTAPVQDDDAEIERGLAAILAKDDTEIMLDKLRELFGADVDVDSRFTIAQILIAMETSFEDGKAHIEMLHRAKAQAASRLSPTPDTGLIEAAKAVLESAATTYRARNGREMGIQGDDGEMCWIVHSDDIETLRAALANAAPAQVESGK